MTNQINKIFILFSYLLFSLIISGCSEGDRKFIAIPEEPVEELDADIFVTGGAVKGPLVNAKINIYKFELDKGSINLYNNALNVWFNLLDENQIQLEDDSYTLGDISEEDVVDNLLDSINQFGYVTELKSFKSELKEATDFAAAITLVNAYIATKETNEIVKGEVQKIVDSSATLSELQRDVNELETLTEKLLGADSFSAASSLLREYRAKESNDKKLDGFTYVQGKVDLLANQASQFGLSGIRNYYTEYVYDVFLNEFSLQNDPVARQHIVELKNSLDSASTVIDAENLIKVAYRKEGNELIKASLAGLLSKIITTADFHDLIVGYDAFYHDFSLRSSAFGSEQTDNEPVPAVKPSFKDLFELITKTFQDNLEEAFRGSLIIENDAGDKTNQLSFGVTNTQGLLSGLVVGQYRGFVYMEAISTSGTIDLNSGSKPIIDKMETIFHTDDILGYGDNDLEDETVYFIVNGEIQRDSDGKLITDVSLVDASPQDKLLTIRPAFFATPLTDLAIGLSIEKLKNILALKDDVDADQMPDNKITETVLNSTLKNSAYTIKETFGINISDQNLLRSSPIRLAEMQYSQESELQAIQYRLSIENYSSFLYDLMNITNLKGSELVDLLAKDLIDDQIDGLNKKEKIDVLSGIDQLQYLLKIDPSERVVPDTSVPVSNIYYLMNQQQAQLLPDEPLALFRSKNSDLSILPPKGGADSDSDGVLENEDQFPNDSTRSRDLNPGYTGIWSVNYNNSETEYMPFNNPFVLRFNKEQVEGLCTLAPCVGLGDISTKIKTTFTLISAPENHDFAEIPQTDTSELGFSAFATTPGNYLVKAEFISDVEPVQAYTFYIPIQVVDPKSIQIKFDPVEPQPGKAISVSFKATKALCTLYPICGEINLNDDEDDFLPLSLLNDIFSINQQLKRQSNTLAYSSVDSQNVTQPISNLSNIELNDTVNLTVSFNAGSRSLVAASYNKIAGGDQDSDGDGVSDLNDFYPLDALCSLEKDGLLDENIDGEMNELDSPFCFEGIQTEATEIQDVNFLNETWLYNPQWHYIIRKNKYSSGYNGYIKTPTLQGTKELIEKFKVDQVSKRVYFAYKNGSVDYYSLESQSIVDFSPSYSFAPVNSMNLLGSYLLVEYGAGVEAKLFNKDASLAVIDTDSAYPFPGNAITLNIDSQNLISATNNLFTIDWALERESNLKDEDGNYIVDVLPVLTTNDELTLGSGQTVFGDVVKVSLTFNTEDDRTIQIIKNIFVLGVNSFSFSDKAFAGDKAISILLADFNSDVLSTNNTRLYVDWYKNDGDPDEFSYALTETKYPFIFEASSFELGDIVRGDIYLKHGGNNLLITSLEAYIVGDLDKFNPTLNSDESTFDNTIRDVNLTLIKPTINYREFDQGVFTPVWKVNGKPVPGESLFTFPALDSTIVSYGDSVSVSYLYSLNGIGGETGDLSIDSMNFNVSSSIFSLDPAVAEVGEDISLAPGQFSETELENLEGRWRINGVVAIDKDKPKNKDTGEYEAFNSLTYPGSKLSYGDEVELLLLRKGTEIKDAFDYIASATVGLNLISLANNQLDPDNDLDSDNDGTPNHLDYFRNDAQCSLKSEGIPDDIDLDGISDLDELKNILKANTNLIDTDGDGLSDYAEINIFNSDPTLTDTDENGISDFEEVKHLIKTNTSPSMSDTDGDGLSDAAEINIHNTDPILKDSDGDGYLDGVEIDLGTDPNDPSQPGNSINDNDFDGLPNADELDNNTKVNVSDTDKDGLSDWFELNIEDRDPRIEVLGIEIDNTNPLEADSDGDKLSDGVELKVTFTNPNLADTDGDGINDGIEVVLKLDPLSTDTDGDGIIDSDESDLDFNITIPSVLFLNDLKNYNSNFSNLLNVEQGTCFKTWLANNKPAFVNNTHNPQLDSTSTQEMAFASDDWNQIIRFDATNNAFADLIKLNIYDAKVTSINYDAVNSNILYVGFSDGWVRQYNSQTKLISDVFNTDRYISITTIVAHDEFLIAEQIDDEGIIYHSVFSLTTPLDENPASTLISGYSYQNSIWLDDSALSRFELISFDENFSSTSFIKETINPALASPVVSSEIVELSTSLESPLFIEQLNAKDILNFANGRSYNLSDNALSAESITPFGFGFEHQSHRIVTQANTSFLEMTTLSNLYEGKYWSLKTQLSNNNVLSVLPVGYHLLAISSSAPTKPKAKDGKIAFQYIELGDESGDSLPDWWNNLSESLTASEYNNYQLTDDAVIPDLLDGTPNVDDSLTTPVLVDTDGDGICDNWETALFNTDPLLADTDSDGMSDAQELSIDVAGTLDCSLYPMFKVISDPLNRDSDSDKLLDGEEAYIYGTQILNPDSDGDGLTDYQEIMITLTDPLNKFSSGKDSDGNDILDGRGDADGDGLTDYQEITLYNTDPQNKDSDGDKLNDDDEVLVYSSNPNETDTDNDGLSDFDEVTFYKTDPNDIDTDLDGLSDFDEISYGSEPLKPDTDFDGLSDFDEFNFEYEYSDEQIEILGNQNLKPSPVKYDTDLDGICDRWEVSNFTSNPAEADTDGDGLTDAQELGIIIDPSMIGSEDNSLSSPESCLSLPVTLPISSHLNRDTDGDRILDGDEVLVLFTDPKDLDSDDNKVNDDLEDPDQDGLNNYQELYQTLTDPLNPDSNNNGINDANDDEDNDGLSNINELNEYGTDPLKQDSDGDGINDKDEVEGSLNPLSTDTDNDGLPDIDELEIYNTDPNNPDTDKDGFTDDEEIAKKTDPNNPDTDNDFLLDGQDPDPLNPDTDSDGIPDGIEVNYLGTDPEEVDSDFDGLSDSHEAWVFAFNYDSVTELETNELMRTGEDLDQDLNSHAGTPGWPTLVNGLVKFNENNLDRLVVDLVDVLDSSFIKGRLYIQRYSNPAVADSDGDGLFDSTEIEIERVYGVDYNETLSQVAFDPLATNFDPLVTNFDNFKVSNPWSAFSISEIDSDADGLSDLYETKYTLTDPNNVDTDGDGISDGLEDEDLDLLNNMEEVLQKTNPNLFDEYLDSDGDGLSDAQETLLTLTDPNKIDTDGNSINDGDEDFDNDGLTNIQEMIYFSDPFSFDLTDAQKDVDGDFYNNILEQNNDSTGVTNPDVDNDSLPDGLEVLLGTNASKSDTDGDGLNDSSEINTLSVREIPTNEFCSDLELRISSVSGKDYCFTIDYKSYPTLVDSDNDGVADRSVNESDNSIILDYFPLDASCYLASDGFTKSDASIQCFSSWMGEGESIDIIKQAEWIDTSGAEDINHADIMFYSSSWDSIVVYNSLTETYGARISVKDEINLAEVSLKDFDFNKTAKLVYMLYSDSTIETYNVQTGLVQTLVDTGADGAPSSLQILNSSKLLLETKTLADSFNLYLIDSSGNELASLLDKNIDINGAASVCADLNANCTESISIFGFIKDSVGSNINLGRLDINLLSDSFEANVATSTILNSQTISGPIKLSLDAMSIQLGSGQIVNLELEDAGSNLSRVHNNKTYETYFDFVEYADHFVGVVDVDLLNVPSGEDVSRTQNGLLVSELESIKDTLKDRLPGDASINDLKELNQYLLPPQKLEEQVLKLIPFVSDVSLDTDGDGLTDYQEINLTKTDPLLKDTDANDTEDAQEDFDGDSVSNLIEVSLGSDPLVSDVPLDTDGDGLTDYQEEKITMTDPLLKDTDGNGTEDAQEDFDGDSVSNLIEVSRGSDPFVPSNELALVKKSNKNIVIEHLGLFDKDADLMTGIYEKVFGLDDTDASDKFADLDEDGLTNIEEYFFATDPSDEDTDNDGWFDIYEILNGTDPNNSLSF